MLTIASATRSSRSASGARRSGLDQFAHLAADGIHQLDRSHLAQHQQAGGDAAQQLRNVVETLRRKIPGLLHRNRHRLLDAREIDDAFAQHRFADLAKFEVLLRRRFGRGGAARGRQNQAHELIVEAVLDRQQYARHLDQRRFGRCLAVAQ